MEITAADLIIHGLCPLREDRDTRSSEGT